MLHIFNPEHDLALASGKTHFTPPHAAKRLRDDLSWLPMLWAGENDQVIVADEKQARLSFLSFLNILSQRLPEANICSDISKITNISSISNTSKINNVYNICNINNIYKKIGISRASDTSKTTNTPATYDTTISDTTISPWGWDAALREELAMHGLSSSSMPTLEELAQIRSLSHRRTALKMLEMIVSQYGLRRVSQYNNLQVINALPQNLLSQKECSSMSDVEAFIAIYNQAILKAPWSSSGRGLRYINQEMDSHQRGWAKNVIMKQGSLMAEPYYNKVRDFGMEFHITKEGRVEYDGLSLFATQNRAYTGNLLASEATKQRMMSRYASQDILEALKQNIVTSAEEILRNQYEGPFGIDMMVVESPVEKGFKLHPCVEINLRRTMGHAALNLSPTDDDIMMLMSISCNKDRYQLSITKMK